MTVDDHRHACVDCRSSRGTLLGLWCRTRCEPAKYAPECPWFRRREVA